MRKEALGSVMDHVRTCVGAPPGEEASDTTSVAALIADGMRGLSLAKATVIGLLLVFGALVAAAGVVGQQPSAPQQASAPAPAAVQKAPKQPVRTDAAGDPLPAGALARIGTLRFRHADHILRLAFTPDAKVILSQASDGIRIWDVATGKELTHLPCGPRQSIQAWDVSADGKMVVVLHGSPANLLSFHDLRTGQELRKIHQETRFETVCFAPNGTAVLTADTDSFLKLWDSRTGKLIRSWRTPTRTIKSLLFSGDGKLLASLGDDRMVRLWDPNSGRPVRAFKVAETRGRIALSVDGRLLAYLGYKQKFLKDDNGVKIPVPSPEPLIRIVDTLTGKELRQIVLNKEGSGVYVEFAFLGDGKKLVTADNVATGDAGIHIWDVATAKELRRMSVDCHSAFGLACSRDGRLLATSAGGQTIRLFDARSGKDLAPPGVHQITAQAALLGKGGSLVTASDRALYFWDAATGKLRYALRLSYPVVAFYQARAAGTLFVWRGTSIQVREPVAGKVLRRLRLGASYYAGMAGMPVSSDGKLLAMTDANAVYLIDARTGEMLRRFTAHKLYVRDLAFAEGDTKLVVFTADHYAHVWDVASGRKVIQYSLVQPRSSNLEYTAYTTAISPDSRLLAYGHPDKYLILSELATGKEVARFSKLPDSVYRLVFSPDGRTIIWGGGQSAPVRLLEVATGKERHRLLGHKGRVTSLDLSADGKLLASASTDTTVLVWDLSIRPIGARLTAAALATCWADLASADAARAYQAMRRLGGDPARAVPFLDKHLHAVRGVSEQHLKQLLADLQAAKFSARESATRELETLGDMATPACCEMLRGPVPVEARRRLENILKKHAEQRRTPPAELMRGLRALEVLERIGGPDAVAILTRISRGAPGAWLTTDAKGAVARLRN